jgi:hypothetical protein
MIIIITRMVRFRLCTLTMWIIVTIYSRHTSINRSNRVTAVVRRTSMTEMTEDGTITATNYHGPHIPWGHWYHYGDDDDDYYQYHPSCWHKSNQSHNHHPHSEEKMAIAATGVVFCIRMTTLDPMDAGIPNPPVYIYCK